MFKYKVGQEVILNKKHFKKLIKNNHQCEFSGINVIKKELDKSFKIVGKDKINTSNHNCNLYTLRNKNIFRFNVSEKEIVPVKNSIRKV